MSLPKETMIELMSYADGEELDGDARARIEELLRTNEEARRLVDAMGTLGEVVREGVEERLGQSAAVAGIADGVMAAIASGPSAGNVVPIGRARRSRTGGVVAAVAAFAVAAGVLFFATSKTEAPLAKVEAVVPAPTVAGESETPGVDIEEVRSIQNKVNVFFMPTTRTAGATSSVVVWIDDRHGAN